MKILKEFYFLNKSWHIKKKITLLNEAELRKIILRLTSEIIEKVQNLDNLVLVGIPTRGVDLAEVLENELFLKTGIKSEKE